MNLTLLIQLKVGLALLYLIKQFIAFFLIFITFYHFYIKYIINNTVGNE